MQESVQKHGVSQDIDHIRALVGSDAEAVDRLIRELGLTEKFGLVEGTDFSGVGR